MVRQQNENLYLNKSFKTKNYGCVKIIEYTNNKNVTVVFEDTGYVCTVRLEHILKGDVRDRTKPTILGVGYLGEASTVGEDGDHTKEYKLWRGVLERCYSKSYHKRRPSYIGCSASEYFKNYTYFAEWCNKQVGFDNEGWHLDKDILVKGNRLYSEDTCCFVPLEVNALFTKNDRLRGDLPIGVTRRAGSKRYRSVFTKNNKMQNCGSFETITEAFLAYKTAKEAYIKEVAERWKDQIDLKVYEALINYEVEITD